MKIKTAGAAAVSPGSKVKSVHEAKVDFKTEFEDGLSATFCLANPGSSVAVRDKIPFRFAALWVYFARNETIRRTEAID